MVTARSQKLQRPYKVHCHHHHHQHHQHHHQHYHHHHHLHHHYKIHCHVRFSHRRVVFVGFDITNYWPWPDLFSKYWQHSPHVYANRECRSHRQLDGHVIVTDPDTRATKRYGAAIWWSIAGQEYPGSNCLTLYWSGQYLLEISEYPDLSWLGKIQYAPLGTDNIKIAYSSST